MRDTEANDSKPHTCFPHCFISFLQPLSRISAEAHVCGDGVALLQAVSAGEKTAFEMSVSLVQGRCSRLSHMVRMEMRGSPTRYPADRKKVISRCMGVLESNGNFFCPIFINIGFQPLTVFLVAQQLWPSMNMPKR